MRWTTWTLFFAAVAVLLGVGAMVSRQSRVTPEEFLAAVEKRIADGRYDREQTLLNLDQVLERAREASDADLESRVLLRRGRILMELGAWDRARTDLLAVAERRPADPEVESDLIELETQVGDFAAAEARVRRGLERAPDSPDSWTRLGRLHRLAAEKSESAAIELLARVLPPDDLAEARTSLGRSIALDPADVSRPAFAQRLRAVLRDSDEEVLQQVLRFTDRATEESWQARDAFARALERGVTPEPLAGLLELFAQAGRPDLAADLASATLRFDVLRTDPAVAQALLAALEDLGRFRYASELARQWAQRRAPLDATFLSLLARIGLRADKWELMFEAGGELRGVGTSDDEAAARFYQGLGLVRGNQDQPGRTFLRSFVASTSPDPVPGGRAMAWRAIAKASRVMGEPEFEREALQGALELEPDFDGTLQLRMAELLMAAPHGGYRIPETRFAKGMSLLPQRTQELLPRWHEIGKRELASIGFDPEAVRAELLRNRIWTPASDASPYELFRLAELHHAAGDEARAQAHLDRLLVIVPGFVPALDLALDVARKQTSQKRLLAAVSARIAAGGRTPETAAVLREIPLEDLEPRDVHDLMRADPEYFGRIAAAETLAREGRPRSALALLETIEGEKLGDEARVLAARLHLDAGQPERAWALLQPMGRSLTAVPQAIDLAVRAACSSGATAEARALLGLAAVDRKLARGRRMNLASLALRAGEIAGARQLLSAIDTIPAARGGDLCLQLAVAATLAGDAAGSKRALARAEAFDTRGGLERVLLAIAIQEGRADEWKALAERVASKSQGPVDPLLDAALLVLRGRDADARTQVAKGFGAGTTLDARWAIVARSMPAQPDEVAPVSPRLGVAAARTLDAFVDSLSPIRDRRAGAAWVVQSAMAESVPMAIAAMRAQVAQAQGEARLWPTWLLSFLSQRIGDAKTAREGADAVLTLAPDMEPAWDLRETLEPELHLDRAAYGLFRGERLQALGRSEGSSSADREDRARWLAARGEHAAAVELADRKTSDAPPTAELTAIAGRSLLELGRPREAVERLARALASVPKPIDVHGCIADLLAAVDAAEASTDPLPLADAVTMLTRLASIHANDPRLVLALARIDLEVDARNPALGVQRAISRLERYRSTHRDQGLDAAEHGAAAAWIEFLARLDPDRALRLADEELDLDPGSMTTWLAAARVHETRGDRTRAVAELRLAARITDRGEVSREILRIRAQSDMEPTEVVNNVAAIQALEGRAEPDPALHLLAARSYLNLGPRLSAQALESARAARAHPLATPSQRRAAALLTAIAILARGRESELGEAVALLADLAPERPSRLEDDFLRALRGLARPVAKPE
ncbi:MAG: hypothetical protein NTY35_14835 [Planctomycetota bacterium]|nr:hypothetical protein [Planctomycetota bacterium]